MPTSLGHVGRSESSYLSAHLKFKENTLDFVIRPMEDCDVDEIYAIELGSHITPWNINILRDCVLVGYDCKVLQLVRPDKTYIAGFLIARHNSGSCHILNFCMRKDKQLQGYGRYFLSHYLSELKRLSVIQSVYLEVRVSNAIAIHLYKTLGFIQLDIKKDYYKDFNSTEDAACFELSCLPSSFQQEM